MAKGLINTRLGKFLKAVSTLSVRDVENEAYNKNVLDQMSDLNTDEQLYNQGVLADGTSTPDYSPVTISYKRAENKRYDHMTFKDTGEMYNSVNYYFNGQLKVSWVDRYDLEENYGQLIGLTKDSIDFIKPEIAENIQDLIKSKL
jgi:hypothetical protein